MKTKNKLTGILSLIILPALFFSIQSKAVNVTIIESLSGNSWAVQDTVWRHVATGMGYNATIVPQGTLDNIANLSTTDMLIVASGTISFTGTNHLQTIIQFVSSGRPAYIQSEYLGTFQGVITFDSIMQAVGANFNWTGTISGQLVPMNVLGTFATAPNNVPVLNYFNYGYAGTGSGVLPFLEFNGNYFGFLYCDSVGTNGTVITVSDEDWVWSAASLPLMENILYNLVTCSATSIFSAASGSSPVNIFPNLFANELTIKETKENGEIIIFNLNGKEVLRQKSFDDETNIKTSHLIPGIYLLQYKEKNKLMNSKIVKL